MHTIIRSRQIALAQLCQRLGVRRLEVFGSAARGDFDESRSDVDFLVELGNDPTVSPLDAYFRLKDELEALLGRSVDLVSAGAIRNPYVMAAINRDRQQIYPA